MADKGIYRHGDVLLIRSVAPGSGYRKMKIGRTVVRLSIRGNDNAILNKAAWIVPEGTGVKEISKFITTGESDKPFYVEIPFDGASLRWMQNGKTLFVPRGIYKVQHKKEAP